MGYGQNIGDGDGLTSWSKSTTSAFDLATARTAWLVPVLQDEKRILSVELDNDSTLFSKNTDIVELCYGLIRWWIDIFPVLSSPCDHELDTDGDNGDGHDIDPIAGPWWGQFFFCDVIESYREHQFLRFTIYMIWFRQWSIFGSLTLSAVLWRSVSTFCKFLSFFVHPPISFLFHSLLCKPRFTFGLSPPSLFSATPLHH